MEQGEKSTSAGTVSLISLCENAIEKKLLKTFSDIATLWVTLLHLRLQS